MENPVIPKCFPGQRGFVEFKRPVPCQFEVWFGAPPPDLAGVFNVVVFNHGENDRIRGIASDMVPPHQKRLISPEPGNPEIERFHILAAGIQNRREPLLREHTVSPSEGVAQKSHPLATRLFHLREFPVPEPLGVGSKRDVLHIEHVQLGLDSRLHLPTEIGIVFDDLEHVVGVPGNGNI